MGPVFRYITDFILHLTEYTADAGELSSAGAAEEYSPIRQAFDLLHNLRVQVGRGIRNQRSVNIRSYQFNHVPSAFQALFVFGNSRAYPCRRADAHPAYSSSSSSAGFPMMASAWFSSSSCLSLKPQRTPTVNKPAAFPVFMSTQVSPT